MRIKLLDQAIVDADGYPYEQDPFVPCSFESCVEDYQPPELRSSDPPNNAAGVELMPTLRLNFDEEVRLVDPTTAAATLSAKTVPAAGGSIPPTQIIDLNPAMLRVWDPNTGATVLDVTPLSELEAQTSYELEIRGDVIEDVSGNPWAGGSVVFNTQCSIYGCVDATTATTTQDFQAEDAGPSTAVYLIVVATLTILCAFGVGVFQMYLRKQLSAHLSQRSDPSSLKSSRMKGVHGIPLLRHACRHHHRLPKQGQRFTGTALRDRCLSKEQVRRQPRLRGHKLTGEGRHARRRTSAAEGAGGPTSGVGPTNPTPTRTPPVARTRSARPAVQVASTPARGTATQPTATQPEMQRQRRRKPSHRSRSVTTLRWRRSSSS